VSFCFTIQVTATLVNVLRVFSDLWASARCVNIPRVLTLKVIELLDMREQ